MNKGEIRCKHCRALRPEEEVFFFQLKFISGRSEVGEQLVPICLICRRTHGEPLHIHVMSQMSHVVWKRSDSKALQQSCSDEITETVARIPNPICPVGRPHPAGARGLTTFALPLFLAERGNEAPPQRLPNQIFTVHICSSCLRERGDPSHVVTIQASNERQIVFENSPALLPLVFQ